MTDAKNKIKSDIFAEYDYYEVIHQDACEMHNMTGEHTEILGQFLDFTAMTPNELKDVLIDGYMSIIKS